MYINAKGEIVVPRVTKIDSEWTVEWRLDFSEFTPGEVRIHSYRKDGTTVQSQRLNFHVDNIDALIGGLQALRAGPLGRMAIMADAESESATKP